MHRPQAEDYNPYFQKYIDMVHREPVIEMQRSMYLMQALLTTITEEQANYRYAEGKWSVKEVLMHIMDVERVFLFRALCASRNDKQVLNSFDDQEYVDNSNASERSMQSLLDEYQAVRMASIRFFEGMRAEMLDRKAATSNGSFITPRALAYIVTGHEMHHYGVLQERYVGKINP